MHARRSGCGWLFRLPRSNAAWLVAKLQSCAVVIEIGSCTTHATGREPAKFTMYVRVVCVCFAVEPGFVFSFGNGGDGQLGLGDLRNRYKPTLVQDLADAKVDATRVLLFRHF